MNLPKRAYDNSIPTLDNMRETEVAKVRDHMELRLTIDDDGFIMDEYA